MSRRVQQVIFIVHGAVTVAAGIVLVALPSAIPATIGILLEPQDYLLCYLLAAAELAIGMLSLGAARLDDPRAVELIAAAFAAFHGATAVLEVVYLVAERGDTVLLANIVVRLLAAAVFLVVARASNRRS